MKTIGQIIGDARAKKRLSFKRLEEITKIKAVFIESIEKEKWQSLPPFNGFRICKKYFGSIRN